MSHDDIIRTGAVVAAVALLAAPYWRQVAEKLTEAADAAKAHLPTIGRVAAAALIVAAAWGKIPVPSLPAAVPTVTVEAPSVRLQELVAPVAKALAPLPASDRILWASVWKKAATVVEGDTSVEAVTFTDTKSLRLFTVLALDLAWRRIGGHAPGSVQGLRDAVESAIGSVVGTDAVAVTPQIRASYAEVARAIAWAGIHGG